MAGFLLPPVNPALGAAPIAPVNTSMPLMPSAPATPSVQVPSSPVGVPQPPSSNPSPGGGLSDVIKQLLPALLSGIAAKQGGAQAGNALLTGYSQGLASKHKAEEEQLAMQAKLDASNAEARQKAQEAQQRRALELFNFTNIVRAEAQKQSDPATFAAIVKKGEETAQMAYGAEPGAISNTTFYSDEKRLKQAKDEAQQKVDQFVKDYLGGDRAQLDNAVASGVLIGDKRLADLVALTDYQSATLPSGEAFQAEPTVEAITDPKQAAKIAVDEARKAARMAGKPFTQLDAQRVSEKAIKDFNEATRLSPQADSGSGSGGTSDVSVLGDQLLGAYLAPSQLGRRANYNQIIADASRKSIALTGKPYDAIKADADMKSALAWASAANSQQRGRLLGLVNSVQPLIDDVLEKAKVIANRGWQFGNKVQMEAYVRGNSNSEKAQAYVEYMTGINALKEEFAQLVQAGYSPTKEAFALAQQQVNENYGFKALNSSLMELKKIIGFRANGIANIPVNYLPGTQSPSESGQGVGRYSGAGPSGQTPPQNPKVGDTWNSPTGPTVYGTDAAGRLGWHPVK